MGIFNFFSKEKKEKLDLGLEKTKTSLLGWKRYIYSQYKILYYLYNKISNDNFLLNIRFDLFTNSFIFPFNEITNFIDNNYNYKKNKFLREGEYCGIDNIIIGTIGTNYKLISFIHYFHV